jgi:hypothetical protein
LVKDKRRWEVRSAGKGSKGQRWYAWAWIATASPRRHLLVRRHLKTGELAFHYCYVPERQLLTKTRLIRAAGLRWPVEEDFELGKDCFGLDQCQALHAPADRLEAFEVEQVRGGPHPKNTVTGLVLRRSARSAATDSTGASPDPPGPGAAAAGRRTR